MASTYTSNIGLEKMGTGDQSGTWGDTTNTNMDIIDRAINGVATITLSGTTHTLTSTDGALSDGGNKVLILSGSPSGTNTITISPNDQDKIYLVNNGSGQSAVFTQGTGGNVTVADGASAWIYADGAGAGAQVRKLSNDLSEDTSPTLGGDLNVNGNSIVSSSNGNINISPNGTGTVVINTDLDVDNININGNTISSTNSDGNITLSPNGGGSVEIDGITYPGTDGSANQAIVTDGSGQLSFADTFLSGMVMPFAGSSAPSGWLMSYGQAVSRTTYASLFTAIGTTYGVGDGSTTFNLPDLRGRVIAGQDDMGSTSANRLTNQSGGLNGDTLGATGGSETHTLTTSEMPSHTHNVQYRTHDTSPGSGGEESDMVRDGTSTRATTSTGGDGAHNNVQPTIILNYIIKT